MFNNLICPISSEKLDSNVSRLTTFFNVVLMLFFLYTSQVIPLVVVTIDYGMRALGYNKYSPLGMCAFIITKGPGWKTKMVGKAPKIFASRLGFICAALGLVFTLANLPIASFVIIALLTTLATLDSVFNHCVGCWIYHHFVFPFFKVKR